MTYPTAYETLLLALAAYRCYILLGYDKLLDGPRDRLPPAVRDWVECRWCAGFWIAVAWVGAWYATEWTTVAAVPFAVATVLVLTDATVDALDKGGE
jgi:hypothetical protein